MFNRIIVPIDGSDESFRAVRVGDRFAASCAADLEIVWVVAGHAELVLQQRALHRQIAGERLTALHPHVEVIDADGKPVADVIGDRLAATSGSLLVMASSGRGRAVGIIGSVATEVLRATFGPVVVVGPGVDRDTEPLGKDIVAAVDGSSYSEASLGLAAAWSIGFGGRLWVTTMLDGGVSSPNDAFESNYVGGLAERLAKMTKRDVEFEVLHGTDPARAVAEFADRVDAGMIVAATHGRTGLARLAVGSTSAGIVRHASCPVVLLRPPELAEHRPVEASHAATH